MGKVEVTRRKHLVRLYSILDVLERHLGGARRLAACSGRLDWPSRGVYFFREPGENRSDTGHGPRIVRVGTHALKTASKATLWKRLSQHKGQQYTGGGNHRGSIFRLIVGSALIARGAVDCPTWGNSKTAKRHVRSQELSLEREVSKTIGRMSFLWLEIDDEPGEGSLRGFVERNSIALLSNYEKFQLDPPSKDWLGRHSDRGRVRKSGLWNQIHVNDVCAPDFLETLDRLVSKMKSAA